MKIGNNCRIGPNVVLGPDVVIEDGKEIYLQGLLLFVVLCLGDCRGLYIEVYCSSRCTDQVSRLAQ